MSKEKGRHYSEKGGHKFRRVFSSAQEKWRRKNNNSGMSLKALFVVSGDIEWGRRRFMQRTPQDGKR